MGNFWRKKDRKFNKNVSVRDLYIYIVYIYILSDEHLGANLSVTENRCVLFDSFTYIYIYIYIYLFIFIDVSLGKSQMNLFLIFFPISYIYVQRGSAYAILLGGWSFAAYLIQFTCGHLKELMVNQYQWVIGYLVIVGGFLGSKMGS